MLGVNFDNKPKFDPKKSFEPVEGKPAFDPSKPVEPAEEVKKKAEALELYGEGLKTLGSFFGLLPQQTAGKTGAELTTDNEQKIKDYVYSQKTPEQKAQSKPLTPKEKAYNEGMKKFSEVITEGSKDPVLDISNKMKTVGDKDEAIKYMAANLLFDQELAKDGVDAKNILDSTHLKDADDNNLTAKLLRDKVAKYDTAIQPLRDIAKFQEYAGAENMSLPFRSALVKKYALSHPTFKKELEATGIDINDDLLANKIPNAKAGQIVNFELSDPDTQTYIYKENNKFIPTLEHVQQTILKEHPDFGVNVVANKVSQAVQKAGYNETDPVFNFYGKGHKEFADLMAQRVLTPEELEIWNNKISANQEEYMDAPSLFQGVGEAGKDFFKGIGKTITEPFTPTSATIKNKWEKESSNVSSNPEGVTKFLRNTGHALGLVGAIGATGNVTGIANAANAGAAATALGFFGNELESGKQKYPDSPVKAWTSAAINTGFYTALAYDIFPAHKVKAAFEKVRPEVGEIVNKLASGKITQEATKNELKGAASKMVDFIGGTMTKNTRIAAEMALGNAINQTFDKINMDEKTFAEHHASGEALDVAKAAFLSNIAIAGLSKFGEVRKGNQIAQDIYYEAATNPKYYERLVDEAAIKNQEINPVEIKSNIKYLSDVKKELDAKGITQQNQNRYLFESLRNRTLKGAEEKTKDQTISKQAKEESKHSEEIMQGILEGKDPEDIVTSKDEKEAKEVLKEESDRNKLEEKGHKVVDKLLEQKDENDKPSFTGIYRDIAKNDPIGFLQEVAQQAQGVDAEGKPLAGGGREKEMIPQYGADVINVAKEMFPAKKPPKISVILPDEVKKPETVTIKPKENEVIQEPVESTEPPKTSEPKAEPPTTDKVAEGTTGEPPKPPTEKQLVSEGGDGKKDLDKLANNIPDSGKVAEYMSKDTIEKYTGELPTNDQRRGVQELEIALSHGEKIIEKAKELFGKDYAEKTLDYIDSSSAGVSNKALMYVSLENALGKEKLLNPDRAADITKQQALVYEKSQAFARENSLALNYQKLRRIAKVGYDIEKITDSFFSPEEKVAKGEISKAVEADADTINKEAELLEKGGMTAEVEKAIQEGVEKEVSKIYEQLPKEKKSAADRAIAALEKAQATLRGKTYDAVLGIPVAIVDAGITTIKNAIKAGVKIADAIELGISKIKEKYGKEWAKEDDFRKDLTDIFSKVKSPKEFVKEALIEKGFGREITIKGEKKNILDWKKLAGAAGTVSKISENVGEVIKDKGFSVKEAEAMKQDFIDEYISLRTSVIEKAQNELAKRNKESVSPEQKSAAKKLSELYTYGLFESKADEFSNTLNKALGAKVSEEGFNEAKQIAKALENIYTSTFKGVRLNDISAKAAIEKLEDRLRVLLFREAKKQGNFPLRAANLVRNYFEIQQTMILNNLKQAVENPFSGLQQNLIDKITTNVGKESTPELANQRRKMMKDVYADMVLEGGIGYGKVESQFVNRQHVDDYVNKLSDNKIYHGIMSVITGKATLNAMDAMWKAGITEKKFTGNLVKILTHETNPKRMSKQDAVAFVSEKLTGQTFKDAQVTAKEVIDKINKDAGKELIGTHKEQVDRLANDIVKSALEMGNKLTTEQISAAYNAAYKSAGLGLGHEANNILSSTVKGYSAKLEGDINRAIKDKEWNRAAMLTMKSVLFRNILNPFVGGGTNWLVLKLEKTGLGLFTGLAYDIGSKSKIDLSTDLGMKRLEARLYNQSRVKDNYMRGLVGGVASMLTYGAFVGIAGTDDYRKWRANNQWAARYLDTITPEVLLAQMAAENDQMGKYFSQSFNKNDAFSASTKLMKAADYAAKGKTNEAWGALGEAVGSKFNAPIPWRLIKDGKVIYQGVTGQDPYHGDYKPSRGFLNGVFQGGVIEWLGARPKPKK